MISARPARPAFAAALIVTLAFIPTRAEALADYADPRNANVDARGATSARIEASAGVLRVQGVPDISEVRVRGTARSNSRSRLGDIKLIAERRGDIVYIKADIPENHGNFWRMGSDYSDMLDLVIEVPVSLALDVDDGSGEAEFRNTGALRLDDGSGNIDIRGTHGSVRLHDGSGNIIIDGVEGGVTVDDGSGEIRASNVTGDFVIESDGSGNIDVSGVGGTLRVEDDGSGNIDVERIAGDFVVDSDGAGDIRYESVKGKVDLPYRKQRGRYRE
jgi:hypothetical protein